MSVIQRFSNELFSTERKTPAAVQLGLTSLLSVTAFAISYFKEPGFSPQYALIGGVSSFVVSHLTDSAIKASWAKNPDGSRPYMFTIIKAGIIGGTIAVSLHLTGIMLKSYNIPLGLENAESTLTMVNMIPIRFI